MTARRHGRASRAYRAAQRWHRNAVVLWQRSRPRCAQVLYPSRVTASAGPGGRTWRPASPAGDVKFRATSTLTQSDQIGLPQLFPWELRAIRSIGAKIVVKTVGNRPQLFTTGVAFLERLCGNRVQERFWSGERDSNPRLSTLGNLSKRPLLSAQLGRLRSTVAHAF
jgi:hypothetical protein